jgi:hypothetical protein
MKAVHFELGANPDVKTTWSIGLQGGEVTTGHRVVALWFGRRYLAMTWLPGWRFSLRRRRPSKAIPQSIGDVINVAIDDAGGIHLTTVITDQRIWDKLAVGGPIRRITAEVRRKP